MAAHVPVGVAELGLDHADELEVVADIEFVGDAHAAMDPSCRGSTRGRPEAYPPVEARVDLAAVRAEAERVRPFVFETP